MRRFQYRPGPARTRAARRLLAQLGAAWLVQAGSAAHAQAVAEPELKLEMTIEVVPVAPPRVESSSDGPGPPAVAPPAVAPPAVAPPAVAPPAVAPPAAAPSTPALPSAAPPSAAPRPPDAAPATAPAAARPPAAAPRADDASERRAPEVATGFTARAIAVGRRSMAVTANAHASRAADWALSMGGSAVDAAIAAQMVLGLVEPQSSGIGGGAFLLHFDAADKRVRAYDGRETAPAAASPRLFLDGQGRPLRFHDAVVGGRSVGVPGVVRMLEAAHRQHGRLPWQSLFEPAIELAERGFEVSPRLHALIASDRFLSRDAASAAYFFGADGKPLAQGSRLRNPAYADTLRRIAMQGGNALHEGDIALDIIARVRAHPSNPGLLDARDLAGYQARERDPVCTAHRDFEICGMPPPSSGGIAVAQILGILRQLPREPLLDARGALRAEAVHRFAEAGRLAFADRDRYVADPDFVAGPLPLQSELLAEPYLVRRASAIQARSMGQAAPGRIESLPAPLAAGASFETPSTSHLSIVDAEGNAVAMTTSIEDQFGARLMVRGFLLNNQLTDFSFAPDGPDGPIANRVEPGKRPRSAMSPTLVFRRQADGRRGPLALAIGSPGGAAIINYVAQALVAVLDDGIDIGRALAMPHFGSRNGPTELEAERMPAELGPALQARGHLLRYAPMTSGLHAIARDCKPDGCLLIGAADPRREGEALGR